MKRGIAIGAIALSVLVVAPGTGGAANQSLSKWTNKHSKVLENLTTTMLRTRLYLSVKNCRTLKGALAVAKRISAPPGDASDWRQALQQLGAGASECTSHPDNIPLSVGTDFKNGAAALGRFIRYLTIHTVALGSELNTQVEKAAIPTTTTSPPTTSLPTAQATQGVGSTQRAEGFKGNLFTDNPYTVQLTQVIDPAHPATSNIDAPKSGSRFIALEFTLKSSGNWQVSGDAAMDSSVVGSNDQKYTTTYGIVSECTNFKYGEFHLDPGISTSGCVVFELPNSVRVSRVEWDAGGQGAPILTWTLQS